MRPSFALVSVVGCLARGDGATWVLTRATRVVRTADPSESSSEALAALAGRPLGTRTFGLMAVYPDPAAHAGHVMEAKGKPDFTYVVRVRESGTDEWSFGCETPITHCTLVDLKPGTEYQVQVRTKHAGREGEPTYTKIHTNPKGIGENVIPFQKR